MVALLSALTGSFAVATPASAAACDLYGSGRVTGGYYATYTCDGMGLVDGYGSTLTDANLEALRLYQTYLTYGDDCSGYGLGPVTGGHAVTLSCSRKGFASGYGSSLTDAAIEARLLVELYGATRQDCDSYGTGPVPGGYSVTLSCSPGGFVSGRGSTLTAAAQLARLSASLG
ncbi:hypothetical protein ABGB07_43585 [Micromonosporaceae bacterium B7E4]